MNHNSLILMTWIFVLLMMPGLIMVETFSAQTASIISLVTSYLVLIFWKS